MFLSNIFIKNNIGEQIIYENHNNYKGKRILDTSFNYIEVRIKNQKKRRYNYDRFIPNIVLYKLDIYERIRRSI